MNLFGLLKKIKKKFYILFFPNNFLDNYYPFFLPVFIKNVSIVLNQKYFYLTLST